MSTEIEKVNEQIRLAVQEAWNKPRNKLTDTFGAFMADAAVGVLAIKVGDRTIEELIEQRLIRPALSANPPAKTRPGFVSDVRLLMPPERLDPADKTHIPFVQG